MNPVPTQPLPAAPAGPDRHGTLGGRALYRACWLAGQWIKFNALRLHVLNRQALDTPGGYQVACTHLSHLEPFLLAMLARRPIDWMTRVEFYAHPLATWFLVRFGAIPVRRQGVSASAVRTAIGRLAAGRVVGICPEGGVATGVGSVCRGGRIKRGVGLIAVRAGRPVIPCVMLNAHSLLRVAPWLPFRRGQLWVAFGDPIHPPAAVAAGRADRRAARDAVAVAVEQASQRLFRQLVDHFGLDANALTDVAHHNVGPKPAARRP